MCAVEDCFSFALFGFEPLKGLLERSEQVTNNNVHSVLWMKYGWSTAFRIAWKIVSGLVNLQMK
jgi:hypothetical protein